MWGSLRLTPIMKTARMIARSALTEPLATAVTNIPKMTVSKNRISVHTLEVDIKRRMPESQKSYKLYNYQRRYIP